MKTTHKTTPHDLHERINTIAAYAIGSIVIALLLAAVVIGIGHIAAGQFHLPSDF